MKNIQGIIAILLLGFAAVGCPKPKDEVDAGELALLSLLLAQLQPRCPGQVAVRWRNESSSTRTFALASDAACVQTVSGSSASNLAAGATSEYACIAAGTYFSGSVPGSCAANSIAYAANRNYTKTFNGTNFGTIADN